MAHFDQSDNDRKFDALMRGLQAPSDSGLFSRVEDFFRENGVVLEDKRDDLGYIETQTSVYKVYETFEDAAAIVCDIAICGGNTFEKQKNFYVLAPAIPSLLESKVRELNHANFFAYVQRKATLATSEMQIARLLRASIAPAEMPVARADDAFYWSAAIKAVAWIAVSIAFYSTLRHRFPEAYLDIIAVVPFWIRAFYGAGTASSISRDFRSPKWRLVEANKLVAPVLAIFLAAAVIFVPPAVVYLGSAALVIDAAAFFSPRVTRSIAYSSTRLPHFLR